MKSPERLKHKGSAPAGSSVGALADRPKGTCPPDEAVWAVDAFVSEVLAYFQSGGENLFDIESPEEARKMLRFFPRQAAEEYQRYVQNPEIVTRQRLSRDQYRKKLRTVLVGIETLVRMGTAYVALPAEELAEIHARHAAGVAEGDLEEEISEDTEAFKFGFIEDLQETAQTLRTVLASVERQRFSSDPTDWPRLWASAALTNGLIWASFGIGKRRFMHAVAAAWEDANLGPIGSIQPSDGPVFRSELRERLKSWGTLKG